MSDNVKERLHAEAERLGFDVSDDLLEQCQETARQLDETADYLDAGTEAAVTTNLDVEPRTAIHVPRNVRRTAIRA